jgi:hypothetical protein
MDYAEHMQQDRRLVILCILNRLPGYESNSSVLYTLITSRGHNISRDLFRSELNWLDEQRLLKTKALGDEGSVLLATLTERGQDVATGRATVPGVKRPSA